MLREEEGRLHSNFFFFGFALPCGDLREFTKNISALLFLFIFPFHSCLPAKTPFSMQHFLHFGGGLREGLVAEEAVQPGERRKTPCLWEEMETFFSSGGGRSLLANKHGKLLQALLTVTDRLEELFPCSDRLTEAWRKERAVVD